MNVLVLGAGGVGAAMARIAETRSFFTSFTLADISLAGAQRAVDALQDSARFSAVQVELASGEWAGVGVLGPESFDASPYLRLLSDYGSAHGMVEMGAGGWPSPVQTGEPGWDRPQRRLRAS